MVSTNQAHYAQHTWSHQTIVMIIHFMWINKECFSLYPRLGLDEDLGENFNPMSTASSDIEAFKRTVLKFQRASKLTDYAHGTLCPAINESMRQLAYTRTKRHTIL